MCYILKRKKDEKMKTRGEETTGVKVEQKQQQQQQQHQQSSGKPPRTGGKKKSSTKMSSVVTAATSASSKNPVRSELDSAKADLKPAVNHFLKSLKSGVKSSVGAAVKVGKRSTAKDSLF